MEIILIVILIIIMYHRPIGLKKFSDTVLGKIIGVLAVVFIAMKFGRNTALIAAVIVILISHNDQEGLKEKKEQPKKEQPKKEQPKKEQPKKEQPKKEQPAPVKKQPAKETPKSIPVSTSSDTYKRGSGLRGGADKKWYRRKTIAKAPVISGRPSRWGGLPVLSSPSTQGVLAKAMSSVPKSSINVIDKDREMKITPLLNSQEDRGQYGGEKEGRVRRPYQ